MNRKTRVSELDKKEVYLLKPLLEGYVYKPYHNYFEFSDFLQVQYIFKRTARLRNNIKIFVLTRGDKIEAACFLEKLAWDTRHFGIKMSEVSFFHAGADYQTTKRNLKHLISQVNDFCVKDSIELLVARLFLREIPIIHALEEDNFLLIANTVTYLKNLRLPNSQAAKIKLESNLKIRFFKQQDLLPLCKIAKSSFSSSEDWFDRFHADDKISNEKADLLYEVWVRNCCLKKLADLVLVAELDGKVAGFICAKIDNLAGSVFNYKIANIPLNAVSKKYRRRGIYMALAAAIIEELKKRKVDLVSISTQSETIGVQKVWQKMEGWPVQIKHVFHKYVKGSKLRYKNSA